jgi:hypothetical protein
VARKVYLTEISGEDADGGNGAGESVANRRMHSEICFMNSHCPLVYLKPERL